MQICIYKIIREQCPWHMEETKQVAKYDQYDSHLYKILYIHLNIYMRSEKHYHWGMLAEAKSGCFEWRDLRIWLHF